MISRIPDEEVTPPAAVAALAGRHQVRAVWTNAMGGTTFEVAAPEAFFVKWTPMGSGIDLGREVVRLRWAVAYTTVPVVLDTGADEEGSWMVSAALPGVTAVTDRWRREPARVVPVLGESLRALHDALPVAECPFSWSAEERLEDARRRVSEGAFDLAYWTSSRHGHLDLYRALAMAADIPPPDRTVVCHGDACSPNTLVTDDGRWSGHVDLGSLGTADRWADLAVAAWSVGWNFGPEWEGLLLESYGIEADPDRIGYYRLLWDLGP
ncbi:MAG TPA: aminoglycoside 3'-phosphotransferase [Acidimicrobiales bacterium]|nr:aminoglycoside 3'-phosphotransferase [Acidimicrobiales bacterium]